MALVLTLIAGTPAGALSETQLAAARESLEELGATVGEADWLGLGEACDLAFEGTEAGPAERHVGARLQGTAIDLAVQAREGRRKAVLVADMESTIIAEEMLDELAEAAGLRAKVGAITARAMAGELDFAAALGERVALLAGLSTQVLEQAAARMTLNPGARTLVRTLAAQGATTALVTGGFGLFADRIAAACGFHEVVANRLEIEDGRLTGRIAAPLVDGAAKRRTLERLCAARGLGPSAACALGDGANDVGMLAAAGLGVAYRGKAPARAAAGARIDHGDLTAVLYLQGIRRDEFVG